MPNLAQKFGLAVLTIGIASAGLAPASAMEPAGHKSYTKAGSFDDIFADLKDAVINRGLVIDFVGHVDKMLERTSKAAGSITASGSKSPYLHAKYLQFCSAKLTHESVSANPYNLAICPYVVFVFEAKANPGKVVVGYRRPIPGRSKLTKATFAKVEDLLRAITKEAASK